MDEKKYQGIIKKTGTDYSIDLLSIGGSAVPWIGGPMGVILSNISSERKYKRIYDVLAGVISDLNGFKSEASEQYVKTDEFEELAEKTLKKVAEERNSEKRDLFRKFLIKAIKFPSIDYNEQMRFIRILEEIQIDQLKILKILFEENHGAQLPSLLHRLPDMTREQVRDLIMHLNSLCITEISTKDGSIAVTEFGRRFVEYIICQ